MTNPTTDTAGYRYPIKSFERFGVELEYMIVDRDTLNVRPICDELLKAISGTYEGEVLPNGDDSPIAWSNELALHVVEFKTAEPAATLNGLGEQFHSHVCRVNELLAPMNARLLPTAMHPWMDPHKELRLWPHEWSPIYAALDRIFSCQGHGWANLQSVHLNLPFAEDEEFGRLHAAIRAVLPLVPAIAAASPVVEGKLTGFKDTRIDVYRTNARRVPSVSGHAIPETVYTRKAYEGELLAGIYRDIAPLDPAGTLQYEWLTARGCIARFDRGSIEVRLLDIQECPKADLAIVALIVEAVRALADERWIDQQSLRSLDMLAMADVLTRTTRDAEAAPVTYAPLLRAFGINKDTATAGDIWQHLVADLIPAGSSWRETLDTICAHGTLATRIVKALGPTPDRPAIAHIYRRLADCLDHNRLFDPGR
ncbi:MAG: glutamate-cysteine ligase family protein [Phycisphaerales bacterium]